MRRYLILTILTPMSLAVPVRAELDAETRALEQAALCQALPYRCHPPAQTLREKARNVAQSILEKERQGTPWRWTDYGLEHNEAQILRVWEALQTLRAAA
jgi:hypothetical protein